MLSANSTAVKKENGTVIRPDFTTVTEMPGSRASREQLSMLYTRYHFAASFCAEKDVLEAACGAGPGLGYLGRRAKKVIGIDIDARNLSVAQSHYRGRQNIELLSMDAHTLEFEDASFDVIILFEAIYYLNQPRRFLAECRRVLRDGGTLLLNTVNPEWRDFNPSPFSTRYFGARELRDLLESSNLKANLFGAFPGSGSSLRFKTISFLKRTAGNLGLIPKTMKDKESLKRIFFGRLEPFPSEVREAMAQYAAPVPLPIDGPVPQYKVLYAAGRKR